MAQRKQFLKQIPTNPELARLLEAARTRPASEDELREQRVSFAFGNAPMSDERITKDSVRRASTHIRLTA